MDQIIQYNVATNIHQPKLFDKLSEALDEYDRLKKVEGLEGEIDYVAVGVRYISSSIFKPALLSRWVVSPVMMPNGRLTNEWGWVTQYDRLPPVKDEFSVFDCASVGDTTLVDLGHVLGKHFGDELRLGLKIVNNEHLNLDAYTEDDFHMEEEWKKSDVNLITGKMKVLDETALDIYLASKDGGICKYCDEYSTKLRPSPFMGDAGSMMCRECWDSTREAYIGSQGTDIGAFDNYSHFTSRNLAYAVIRGLE